MLLVLSLLPVAAAVCVAASGAAAAAAVTTAWLVGPATTAGCPGRAQLSKLKTGRRQRARDSHSHSHRQWKLDLASSEWSSRLNRSPGLGSDAKLYKNFRFNGF